MKRQYVLNHMAKDPTNKQGPHTIKEVITTIMGFIWQSNVEYLVMHSWSPFNLTVGISLNLKCDCKTRSALSFVSHTQRRFKESHWLPSDHTMSGAGTATINWQLSVPSVGNVRQMEWKVVGNWGSTEQPTQEYHCISISSSCVWIEWYVLTSECGCCGTEHDNQECPFKVLPTAEVRPLISLGLQMHYGMSLHNIMCMIHIQTAIIIF